MENEFREAIEAVMRNFFSGYASIVIGKATNVTDTICKVTRDNGPELLDVRLNALVPAQTSYNTNVPKEGSTVLCGIIENDKTEAVVLVCSEVEKVIWKCGTMTFEFKGTEVLFNNGTNGGLIKINELTSELAKVNQVLQAIMTVLSGAPIPEPGSGANSALQTALNAAITGLTLPDYNSIENTDIKH